MQGETLCSVVSAWRGCGCLYGWIGGGLVDGEKYIFLAAPPKEDILLTTIYVLSNHSVHSTLHYKVVQSTF